MSALTLKLAGKMGKKANDQSAKIPDKCGGVTRVLMNSSKEVAGTWYPDGRSPEGTGGFLFEE